MAGVPDIPVVKQVVDRISEVAANAVFRGFRYLFCYKNEMENVLKSEMENVKNVEDKVNQKSVQERANGNTIKPHVIKWQKEIKEFQESAEDFSERYKNRASWTCLKCLPIPNPISRFRLGREAARTTTMAIDLVKDGETLMNNPISDPPPIDDLPNPAVEFEDFESRKSVYGQLWEALVTEGSSRILGIYGMPGVGKTRMMEQLCKEAMEKKKFDKVVRANVGHEELNVIKLQDQIAADLNCKFDAEDNKNRRAARLKNSLMDRNKVLVIFDDVWSEIPTENIIGTDFGERGSSKGSKILVTSRREDVCLKNKCQRLVHIKTLKDEEAWDLFQKTVGADHINDLQDDNLAKKVCAKCAGLPLLISAVGKALQSMSPNHHAWNYALNKLEKGNFNEIEGIDPQVYACVKLSIDILKEDAKICLFLCSLFPEDADIHITTLIQFAIGSQLILDGESAIPTMVDVLTKSSLLLECDEYYITRMHDIIRDVSRFEASEGSKYAFLQVKSGGSRLTDIAGYNTSKLLRPKLLRLDVEGDQFHFPKYLVATDLYTLWLHCDDHLRQFPGGFFGMFVNLGFLILQTLYSLPEHFSLEPLGELNMLIFDGCDITKTDVRLFPKNLNTLCIWDCHLPSPLDLSNLNNLLRLDIQQEFGEVVMVRNAISSLCLLEEMHIPDGIRFSDDANGVTPILDEISKLTCLRSLKIYFSDFEPCQGTALFKKLSKYDISVGRWRTNLKPLPKSTKIIELNDVEVKGDEGIQSLLERAEKVKLRTDVDVSSISKSNREAFTDLKELSIESCDRVEYIARISQDEIQHIRQPQTSFSKLTILKIRRCSAMKYLFCKFVAKCLGQLQKLYIEDCPAMEAIVMDEGTSDGEIINFSKLRSLRLDGLKSLRSFYSKNKEMHRGSTDNSVISCAEFPPLFDEMVAFPSLEDLGISCLENTCIWGNIIVSSTSFCKLKKLAVWKCSKLESVIPVSMLNRLQHLEYLLIDLCSRLRNAFPPCIARDLIRVKKICISSCGKMREIIGGGGDEQKEKEISDYGDHHIIVFPQLTELILLDLENLTSFWDCECKVEFPCLEAFTVYGWWPRELKSLHFPNLKDLDVSRCGRSALFTISDFRSLKQLKTLEISDCDLLEEIVEDVRGDELDEIDTKTIIELLQLDSVYFRNLPKLRSFMGGANYECCMSALTKLKVDNCGLSSLFPSCIAREHNSHNNIVSFSSFCKLKSLEVKKCSKLESVIPVSMLERLQNLEDLFIKECSSLKNAFPPCIARNLQRLSISGCDMMREVIGGAVEQKEKEISGDHDLIIVFPKLTMLELVNLKNLTTFWCYQDRECKVQFPSLVKFELSSCEVINLEAIEFCRDDSTCPLKSMSIKSENHMQLPCKWQRHLYNLETLRLTHCWGHELKSLCFPKLKNLEVSNCGHSALFTISGFGSLQQLQTLDVSNCDLLEDIVEDVKGDGHDEMDKKTIIELLQLDSVVFKDLPNLKSFTHGANYECYMPALKKMEFDNCGLTSLFTCSVFRNLQQLHQLVVSNCRLLEAIVEDGRGDGETSDTNDKVIIHSNLFSVTLEDLPHLSSFSCRESYAFNMSRLKIIHLLKCPQLENLNDIRSTEIVSVSTEHGYEEVTDLNDFITKHRKRGSNLVALLENQVTNQELETDSGILEEGKHQEG